jgi:hypothetical protein
MAPLSSLLVKSHLLHKTLSDFYLLTDELVSEKSLVSKSFEDKLLYVFGRSPLRAVQLVSHVTVLVLLVLQIQRVSVLVRLKPVFYQWITILLIFGICIDTVSNLQPYQPEDKESEDRSLENINSFLRYSVRSPAAISVMLCLINLVSIPILFKKSFIDIPTISIYGMRLISLVQLAPSSILMLALFSNDMYKQFGQAISSWWESPKNESFVNNVTANALDPRGSNASEYGEEFDPLHNLTKDDSVGCSHSLIFKLLSDIQQYGNFLMLFASLSLLREVMRQTKESMFSVLLTICYSLVILQVFSHMYRELCVSENGLFFSVRSCLFGKANGRSATESIGETMQGVKILLSRFSSLAHRFRDSAQEQNVEEEGEEEETASEDAISYEEAQEDHDGSDSRLKKNKLSTGSSKRNAKKRQRVLLAKALRKQQLQKQKRNDPVGLEESLKPLSLINNDNDDQIESPIDTDTVISSDKSSGNQQKLKSDMPINEIDIDIITGTEEDSWEGDDDYVQPEIESADILDDTIAEKSKEGQRLASLSAEESESAKNRPSEVESGRSTELSTAFDNEESANEIESVEDSSECEYEYYYEDVDTVPEPLTEASPSLQEDHLLPNGAEPIQDPDEIVVDLDDESSIGSIRSSNDTRNRQATETVMENEASHLFFDDEDGDDIK